MDLNTTINLKTKTVIENTIEITIQEIIDMFGKEIELAMDSYYIYDSDPELSTDDYGESVTVHLSLGDRKKSDDIIEDSKIMFQEAIEEYFKDKMAAASLPQKNEEPNESGEVAL